MFLRLLYGGHDVLDDVEYKDNASLTKIKVICMAQDIIYHLSKGKLWTSKHIGLTSTQSGHEFYGLSKFISSGWSLSSL